MIPSIIKIGSFAKRCIMGTLGEKGLINSVALILQAVGSKLASQIPAIPFFLINCKP